MSKIGIFDSGIGGLSVFKVIYKEFPKNDFFYVGDEAYYPYGIKTKEEIIDRSLKIVNFLIKKDIDLIIVACNTVSSVALSYLKENFKVPIIGVIDGAVIKAIKIARNNKIGVISTPLTAKTHVYKNKINSLNENIEVLEVGSQELVNIVENGIINESPTFNLVKEILKPFENFDTLILGCTHFPALEEVIRKNLKNIQIVDPAYEIIPFIKHLIKNNGNGIKKFYTTKDPETFKERSKIFLEDMKINVEKISI
ncbi:MAG: glutamate racemase [Caldisericia bacterium]|nr:glutamate racemase [Caldisericia bacterium]